MLDGLTYTLDLTKSGADRVVTDSIRLNGEAIDPSASYRVATNSFLAGGGDGFATSSARAPTTWSATTI
ncbi:hypothetical protein SALBM217S_06409 [Streptomyces griseoloalbus]